MGSYDQSVTGPIWLLLGFGVLVLVTLALRLELLAGELAMSRRAVWAAVPAAIMAVFASRIGGRTALVLAAPWALLATCRAVVGIRRTLVAPREIASWIEAAAGGYWLVASGWLALAAARVSVRGVPPVIVLLTAVHFHFTGYMSLVLAGEAGRRLAADDLRSRRLWQIASLAIAIAMPLIAAGFVLWPPLQAIGAIPLVIAEIAIAFLLAFEVAEPRRAIARWLLWVAAFSSIAPMVFGAMFVTRVLFGAPPISLAQMVPMHGVLNCFGFLGCALLGCNLGARDGSVLRSP